MDHSVKYNFFMSQLTVIENLKETEKTKISVVYHAGLKASCILRVCKNRDLSQVCIALRKIRNPNTVVVHDFVYENGDTYILEENVDGSTVEELLCEAEAFSEKRTAAIIIEVCKALEQLHKEKPPVVHNDINPSNIKIREDGSVKLFDFDISRIYKKGQSQNTMLFGTEEYASPEHFGYGQSEPRTDIYCLGVTMHKMLTGRGLSSEHRITYDGSLKNVIRKCLEFDPKNRYGSVLALRRDLEKFLTKKRRVIYTVLGVLIAGITACGLLWGLSQIRPQNGNGPTDTIVTEPADDTETTDTKANENHNGASESTKSETVNDHETTAPTELELNDTRETAWTISFDQSQTGVCDRESSKWYKFITSNDDSVYRIGVSPIEAPTNMVFPFLEVGIYNSAGMKLEGFDAWADDKYDFADLYLESNTEYFIKIGLGSRFDVGNYELCVSSKICDAGIDKEHAAELVLEEQCSGIIDSTLSDWYVFRVPETGEYTYTVHNIDVGCEIYFSKQQPRSAGEGMYIENEDNYSGKILDVQEGELVYFEIYAYNKNPEANGGYIIVVEKANT